MIDDEALPRTHSAVRERNVGSDRSYAAVYPNLKAGMYTIEGSMQRVSIVGGTVTVVVFGTNPDS